MGTAQQACAAPVNRWAVPEALTAANSCINSIRVSLQGHKQWSGTPDILSSTDAAAVNLSMIGRHQAKHCTCCFVRAGHGPWHRIMLVPCLISKEW